MRLVKPRLASKVVAAPSLEVLKVRLKGLCTNQSSRRCLCSSQEGWTKWPLKVPSNPNYSMTLQLVPRGDFTPIHSLMQVLGQVSVPEDLGNYTLGTFKMVAPEFNVKQNHI